jgi:predicted nucleic acid-binding protein
MAYLISDIRQKQPELNKIYLFDTNVWLAVLEDFFFDTRYKPYTDFFNKLISQTIGNAPKIALPAVLISEILNRVLRDIYYPSYIDSFEDPTITDMTLSFKKYRNTDQYEKDLAFVLGSIRQYHNSLVFVSDNFGQYTSKQILKNLPTHLDYNDYLYTIIAKEQNLIIVTNDADFSVEDIPIYTTRKELKLMAQR